MDTQRKPGWYGQPDLQPGQKRYWDGEQWTDKVSNAPGPAGSGHIAVGVLIAAAALVAVVVWGLLFLDIASMG